MLSPDLPTSQRLCLRMSVAGFLLRTWGSHSKSLSKSLASLACHPSPLCPHHMHIDSHLLTPRSVLPRSPQAVMNPRTHMCAYTHIQRHTCTHMCTYHTHYHEYIHICLHTQTHTCTHMQATHTRMHTNTCTHSHYAHPLIYIVTHVHTPIHAYTCTPTCTHSNMYTYIGS